MDERNVIRFSFLKEFINEEIYVLNKKVQYDDSIDESIKEDNAEKNDQTKVVVDVQVPDAVIDNKGFENPPEPRSGYLSSVHVIVDDPYKGDEVSLKFKRIVQTFLKPAGIAHEQISFYRLDNAKSIAELKGIILYFGERENLKEAVPAPESELLIFPALEKTVVSKYLKKEMWEKIKSSITVK